MSPDFKIVKAESQYKDQWDAFVSRHPDASPYHAYAWLEAVQSAYKHTNAGLIAFEGDEIVGVLPAVKMSLPLLKPKLVSLPFCDMGYPLSKDDSVREQLTKSYLDSAQALNASSAELRDYLRHSGNNTEVEPIESGRKVSMLLPLPADKDDLWGSFKSKLRSQVRKAEKNGLSSELGNSPSLLDEFYEVFAENMRKLGSPVHSKQWFEALRTSYKDNLLIGVVRNEGQCIGAGIVISTGNKVSIPWASTLAEFNRLSPNMMLYWNFLAYACDSGKEQFDFGRSSFGEGTFKFKQQWGAQPRPLDWQDLLVTGSSADIKAEGPTSNLRDKVEKIWAKLPLSLTKTLGPQIRRHISL